MARVLRFHTSVFDVSKETPNRFNPIPGESLLVWLREQVRGEVELSPPDAEDWGWYCSVEWKGRSYLIGASASEEAPDGSREWVLQIDKRRSLAEKLLRRAVMSEDDECVRYLQSLLERETRFRDLSVDSD